MEIRNPRTGKFDFSIQPVDANGVRSRTISLRASQPGWMAKGIEQRVRVLQQWHTLIEDYSTDLLESLIDDTGERLNRRKSSIMCFVPLIVGVKLPRRFCASQRVCLLLFLC
jgi:aldehyde dehydrogenase (NAD+)